MFAFLIAQVCGQFGELCAVYLPLLKYLPHVRLHCVGHSALHDHIKSILREHYSGVTTPGDTDVCKDSKSEDDIYIQVNSLQKASSIIVTSSI